MKAILNEEALIGSHRIACGRHGSGIPVVLLHGTPSHSFAWRNVIGPLSAAGIAVHCFDLLGFGKSERPLKTSTSVAAQGDVLAALLEHWQLPAPHLIGHDIGGAIAMRHAVFRPRQLASLTLIDTVSYDSWPSQTWREIIDRHLEDDAALAAEEMRILLTRQLRMAVHSPGRMTNDVLEAYLDVLTGPIGQPSFFEHQVKHYDSRYTMEISHRLGEIAVPTQVVWGERDNWQPVKYARRLAADIPGARLHVIPEAGHFLMEDAPKAVCNLVESFVVEAENARH